MTQDLLLRAATRGDAADLAWFINTAGEGIPLDYWIELAKPGEDPWEVGRRRMQAESGDNSWRNWTIAESGGQVMGGLCTYVIPEQSEPPGEDIPPRFRPMAELEHLAAGTLHVHVLAIRPETRRKGVGNALLDHGGQQAQGRPQSIIVDSNNQPACALYAKVGFVMSDSRAILDAKGIASGGDWLLLTR